MAAGNRQEHEILVVSGRECGPAERRVGVLAADAHVVARAERTCPLRVQQVAGPVVGESLRRPGRRRPPCMGLDLAHCPPPRAPAVEDDVDRVDAIGSRARTAAVRVRPAAVEVGRCHPGEHERKHREHQHESAKPGDRDLLPRRKRACLEATWPRLTTLCQFSVETMQRSDLRVPQSEDVDGRADLGELVHAVCLAGRQAYAAV